MNRGALGLILFAVFLISASSAPVQQQMQNVNIYSFHINSTVTSRYATTIITSRVANKLNESQEIFFDVKIPKNAFISKFRMTIEGKSYDGVVKEKGDAQQQYSQAVSRGQSAGLIKTVGRTLEDFKTSVTVAALSKVTFELTYEELLQRRLGKYELLINAQPMQTVADFKIDVHIQEKPGISFLEVTGDLSTNDLANAVQTTRSDNHAWVTFYPTRDQQKLCKNCGENGLNGDLIISYDVERENPNGEMRVSNGFFVHNFAPLNVPRIPKNVVFIIDRSGSMHGRKIEQTRLALLRILSDLDDDDHFGLITFDREIILWKRELLKATKANLKDAKSFVRSIEDRGATDINAAVLEGVKMINQHVQDGTASILILLTDGDPTTGETNIESIMSNVRKAIASKFPLYCLGFGYDVNFDFLTKMSLENNGAARRIYEDSDADLQLQGFYDEVAVPLLSDIQLNYVGVSNLTQTKFNLYFNGSEIVVSGQITDNSIDGITSEVIAISKGTEVTYRDSVVTKDESDVPPEREDFMERLWAYLTVKQLLDKQVLLGGEEQEAVKKEVLSLSLKYQFVTPLTSMVVTKPQEGDVEIADKPKEGKESRRQSIPRVNPRTHSIILDTYLRSPNQGSSHSIPSRHSRPDQGRSYLITDRLLRKRPRPVRPPSQKSLTPFLVGGESMSDVTIIEPTLTATDVHKNRFLLPADGQSEALCFDVPLPHKLKLLRYSSIGFTMNGESNTTKIGFSQITVRFKKNRLTINTNSISYRNDQDNVNLLWGQISTLPNIDGLDLIITQNKISISIGDFTVDVLLHDKDGDLFLWPAVQQYPQDNNPLGILGKANISYEKIQGFSKPTLKIKDKDVEASMTDVTDYRSHLAPVVRCWLVPFKAVMDGEISDFTVNRL